MRMSLFQVSRRGRVRGAMRVRNGRKRGRIGTATGKIDYRVAEAQDERFSLSASLRARG